MTARADLPVLADLPIPTDVAVGPTWPPSMVEMADYIGAFDALRVSEALGGQEVYIPKDPRRSPFADVLDGEQIATLAHVYGGSRYSVPTGTRELLAARRAGVVAAVRSKRLSVQDAATICRTSRTYMSFLVNHTQQGKGATVPPLLRRGQADPRQIDLFDH
jgi:hypothetical protein